MFIRIKTWRSLDTDSESQLGPYVKTVQPAQPQSKMDAYSTFTPQTLETLLIHVLRWMQTALNPSKTVTQQKEKLRVKLKWWKPGVKRAIFMLTNDFGKWWLEHKCYEVQLTI